MEVTLTPVPGAERRYEDGKEIVEILTCGTCGRSWNNAAVSDVTPVPSGRCPFEYEHAVSTAPECPVCGQSDTFEMRGDQRIYAPLNDRGEREGWNKGDIEWDNNDDGKDIVYCTYCDSEFSHPEIFGKGLK